MVKQNLKAELINIKHQSKINFLFLILFHFLLSVQMNPYGYPSGSGFVPPGSTMYPRPPLAPGQFPTQPPFPPGSAPFPSPPGVVPFHTSPGMHMTAPIPSYPVMSGVTIASAPPLPVSTPYYAAPGGKIFIIYLCFFFSLHCYTHSTSYSSATFNNISSSRLETHNYRYIFL